MREAQDASAMVLQSYFKCSCGRERVEMGRERGGHPRGEARSVAEACCRMYDLVLSEVGGAGRRRGGRRWSKGGMGSACRP